VTFLIVNITVLTIIDGTVALVSVVFSLIRLIEVPECSSFGTCRPMFLQEKYDFAVVICGQVMVKS